MGNPKTIADLKDCHAPFSEVIYLSESKEEQFKLVERSCYKAKLWKIYSYIGISHYAVFDWTFFNLIGEDKI